MNNIITLIICLLVSSYLFTACGGNGSESNDGNYSSSFYTLKYKDSGDNTPYIDWETSHISPFLTLEFEDLPMGTEWYLECDASWIHLKKDHGKINSNTEIVPFTIDENYDYSDRKANIRLDVPNRNGYPISTLYTTVTIHQYGFDSLLEMGRSISIRTNRSKSESAILTIEQLKVYRVMEVDWGDGNKDVLTKKDYYSTSNLSISHKYHSADSYNVKLCFAPENGKTSFSFILGKNQGIEKIDYYEYGDVSVGISDSKKVSVSYSDNSGFKVNQY